MFCVFLILLWILLQNYFYRIVGIIFFLESFCWRCFAFCLIFFNLVSFASETCFLFRVTNERKSLLNKVPCLSKSRLDTFHWVALSWEPSNCCHGRKSRQAVAFSGGATSTQRVRSGRAGSQPKLCRHDRVSNSTRCTEFLDAAKPAEELTTLWSEKLALTCAGRPARQSNLWDIFSTWVTRARLFSSLSNFNLRPRLEGRKTTRNVIIRLSQQKGLMREISSCLRFLSPKHSNRVICWPKIIYIQKSLKMAQTQSAKTVCFTIPEQSVWQFDYIIAAYHPVKIAANCGEGEGDRTTYQARAQCLKMYI